MCRQGKVTTSSPSLNSSIQIEQVTSSLLFLIFFLNFEEGNYYFASLLRGFTLSCSPIIPYLRLLTSETFLQHTRITLHRYQIQSIIESEFSFHFFSLDYDRIYQSVACDVIP